MLPGQCFETVLGIKLQAWLKLLCFPADAAQPDVGAGCARYASRFAVRAGSRGGETAALRGLSVAAAAVCAGWQGWPVGHGPSFAWSAR